jgi:2-isopropylmalate synthase
MTYEAVIRVNSCVTPSQIPVLSLTRMNPRRQSGKGGVAYLVQRSLQLDLPRRMQVAFYQVIQALSERTSKEITPEDIEKAFRSSYFLGVPHAGRFALGDYQFGGEGGKKTFKGTITDNGVSKVVEGTGNGPVSSLLDALRSLGIDLDVKEYSEHSIGTGSTTQAASYVELVDKSGRGIWGVGIDEDITSSTLQAVLSAASGANETAEERIKNVESVVLENRV